MSIWAENRRFPYQKFWNNGRFPCKIFLKNGRFPYEIFLKNEKPNPMNANFRTHDLSPRRRVKNLRAVLRWKDADFNVLISEVSKSGRNREKVAALIYKKCHL